MEKALIDTDIWLDIMKGVHSRVREHAEVYWNAFGQFTLKISDARGNQFLTRIAVYSK
jgi:hypothetical protein